MLPITHEPPRKRGEVHEGAKYWSVNRPAKGKGESREACVKWDE